MLHWQIILKFGWLYWSADLNRTDCCKMFWLNWFEAITHLILELYFKNKSFSFSIMSPILFNRGGNCYYHNIYPSHTMVLWSLSLFYPKRVTITHINMILTVHLSNCNENIVILSASPALFFLKVGIAESIMFWQHNLSTDTTT